MRILTTGFALSLLVSGIAFADGAKPAAGKDKLTGEVVDITCYASHAGKGEKHAACAQKCMQSGLPAGIVADGKLYTVIMSDHSSPNTKLAAWAGKTVTATGTKIERDGAQIFEIDTVTPGAAAAK
jgi:hypothetical protein